MRRLLLSAALTAANAAMLVSIAKTRTVELALFVSLVSLLCLIEASLVDETPRGGNNLAVPATLTGLAIVVTFAAAIRAASPQHRELLVPGALLVAAGVALRCAAIIQLGPRFVSELRRSDEPLVRTGAYRWLDHPSEAGLLLVSFGAAVLFRSWVAAAVWALTVVPLTAVRIRIENAFLLSSSTS